MPNVMADVPHCKRCLFAPYKPTPWATYGDDTTCAGCVKRAKGAQEAPVALIGAEANKK